MCWGDNEHGQASPPQDMEFISVSAGLSHTCAVRAGDRKLICWGWDEFDEGLLDPAVEPAFLSVQSGANHTCAIIDGDHSVFCWGKSSPGFRVIRARFASVTTGSSADCGIVESDGSIQCWREEFEGDFDGIYGPDYEVNFLKPPTEGEFSEIDAGSHFVCAIRVDTGHLECWGDEHELLAPPTNVAFSSVSVGNGQACGILQEGGGLICWGEKLASDGPHGALEWLSRP